MARAQLTTLDPVIEERLTIESFEDKFDLREFIGAVSEGLITRSQEDPGPFDPKPFISTFEATVDNLINVRKDLQKKTENMEQSVRSAEKEFSRKMVQLNSNFEEVSKQFSGMESKISEVGRTAIRIGEQLEAVHSSRQRAQTAHDLLDYYIQFSRDDTTRLDALKKDGGKEGRERVSVILRRLSAMAKEVDIPVAEKTRESIDKYCEKFEKDMLGLFDRSYRKGNPAMMTHCAKVLMDFNGGNSCVQIYVNQHTFFISKSTLFTIDTDGYSQLWETLPDPDSLPPARESVLASLCSAVRKTVGEEIKIVDAVFPNPSVVIQIFLQRIFAQSIQQYLEQLLNHSAQLSPLAFLRMLKVSHAQTAALVDVLKSYDLSYMSSRSVDANKAAAQSSSVAISTMLDASMEELFVPYMEGSRYLEKETKCLAELYMLNLYPFSRWHELIPRGKSTGGLLDRMVNQLTTTAAATSSVTGNATATAQAAQAFMKFSGISGEKPKEKDGDYQPTEEDGRLTVEMAEKMLKWHAESIGRCVELSASGDLPKNVFALMKVLADALGRQYLEIALETVQVKLESRDPKQEPDYAALAIVRQVEMICHLWQQYISIALLPLASSSIVVRREMSVFNSQIINRIEALTNTVLQKVSDSVINWLAGQLQKQKRLDYKPRNDDMGTLGTNTEPCQACCHSVTKTLETAKENLSGMNQEVFLTEIGVAFQSLLLEHLKKFPVSETGGITLVKDLKAYQDVMNKFGIPAIDERFDFVRLLGNLFFLPPDAIKAYIEDNALARVELPLLRPYLMQRSDWGMFTLPGLDGVAGQSAGLEGENEATDGILSSGGRVLKERLGTGRLGAMMREFESLKIGADDFKGFTLPTMPSIPSMQTMSGRVRGTGGL